MLDYLFFDHDIAHKFMQHAQTLTPDVRQQVQRDGHGIAIEVDESRLDERAREQLERWYDALFFGEQAALVAHEEQGSEACAVQIQLANGDYTSVMLAPDMMKKLLSVLETEEMQTLFAQIADAVEHPQHLSVCHVMQCDMQQAV